MNSDTEVECNDLNEPSQALYARCAQLARKAKAANAQVAYTYCQHAYLVIQAIEYEVKLDGEPVKVSDAEDALAMAEREYQREIKRPSFASRVFGRIDRFLLRWSI